MLKKQSPARLIAAGYAAVILIGTLLLSLPISVRDGAHVSFVDALFTSTSAVCVTGLIAIDTADTFTVFGRTVVALLIQIGGLGITCASVSVILAARRRVGLKERLMIMESWNIDSFNGVVRLVKSVLLMTLIFEGVGAALSFIVFVRDYPPLEALGISLFHAVAAFNNAGFDILGGLRNLAPYRDNVLLNLVTCGLIVFGGLGFLVILDVLKTRRFRKLSFHSKVVLVMTAALLAAGTLLLKATEKDITWLGAFFHSTSARTAGFSTYPLGTFSSAALFVLIILMFIGASPGSTGGGIKTTTFFVLLQEMKRIATKRSCRAFHRKVPAESVQKAFHVALLSATVVCLGTFLLCVLEPDFSFLQLMFEAASAFATVGLSTGITPHLGGASKLVVILIMYIGRIGALTFVSLGASKPVHEQVSCVEEPITIG